MTDKLKGAENASGLNRDHFISMMDHPDTGVNIVHDGAPYLRPDPSRVEITRPRLVKTDTATVVDFGVTVVLEDRSEVLGRGDTDE